jgi:hypothetical protein
MTTTTAPVDPVVSMTRSELESLIRRVVREELRRALHADILNDWSHEGPDDPEGDEIIAREALAQIEEIQRDPSRLIKWDDFKKELAQKEDIDYDSLAT